MAKRLVSGVDGAGGIAVLDGPSERYAEVKLGGFVICPVDINRAIKYRWIEGPPGQL